MWRGAAEALDTMVSNSSWASVLEAMSEKGEGRRFIMVRGGGWPRFECFWKEGQMGADSPMG